MKRQPIKPCARLPDAGRDARSASGDPAMVLKRWMASSFRFGAGQCCLAFEPAQRAPCPSSPSRRSAAGRTCVWRERFHENVSKFTPRSGPSMARNGVRMVCPKNRIRFFRNHTQKRARLARVFSSTTNVVLFEQRFVTRLVLFLDVIEKRTARGYELQQPAARMVVLYVGLEVPGEIIDAFREDRDLNLGRAGVAGLGGVRLDDFRFAFGGNRHRQTLSWLRAGLAVSPVRLNTRLGMSSPLPISARARSRPATVT